MLSPHLDRRDAPLHGFPALRALGSLRPHLGDEQAVQYARAVHYLLHLRDDLHERERVEFVKDMLLSTLLRDEKNKYARRGQ